MAKIHEDNKSISANKFMDDLWRYKHGSVSRRHFLGITGLGTAMAVMSAAVPGLAPREAYAFGEVGTKLVFSTWPNYHNPVNIEEFTKVFLSLIMLFRHHWIQNPPRRKSGPVHSCPQMRVLMRHPIRS